MKFKKEQLKLFWYWMRERHAIYLRRFDKKEPYPWTEDEILREYKFTNVYRQLDRVTEAWGDRYARLIASREKNSSKVKKADIFFHCLVFRLFNLPETYDALNFGLGNGKGLAKWDKDEAIELLTKRQKEDHEQIFTGAYIIPNAGRDDPKIQVICEAVDYAFKRKIKLSNMIIRAKSMQRTVEILQKIPTVGPFIAYEIACDLRFTRVLHNARDVFSWANPGPGAMRGIHRLMTGSKDFKGKRPDYVQAMRELYKAMPQSLRDFLYMGNRGVPLELREIEHSLCEFDKYMRVKNGEGKPRSRYRHVEKVDMPYGDEEE